MSLAFPTGTADKLKLAAVGSIVVAMAVMGLKYAAYWVTGSVALYSDALESIVNLITALVALYAIHVAVQPADRRHQFGHHKAEYFSAVLEGVLIVVAALLIFREAYDAFLPPPGADRADAGPSHQRRSHRSQRGLVLFPPDLGPRPALAGAGRRRLAPADRRRHLRRRHRRADAGAGDRLAGRSIPCSRRSSAPIFCGRDGASSPSP